jgi:hypothetical protein
MLTRGELLDRMEILYPYDSRFADLRRAYIDQDMSSIFRILEHYHGTISEEVRKAFIENNMHSIFRILKLYPECNDDLRKAILEHNLWSLFRLFDPSEHKLTVIDASDIKKCIMDHNTWSMYRLLLDFQDNQFVRTIKGLHNSGTRWDKDSMSRGQLESKIWLVNELATLDLELGTVFLCAGWYGLLATLMFAHDLNITKVRSFDIDPTVVDIADKFNLPQFSDSWKFKAVTDDIHDINYECHNWIAWSNSNNRDSLPIADTPNTIINTSCEHIANFDEWYAKIPTGKLVILQSNDYVDIDEHVNTSPDLNAFGLQTPMSEVLYNGEMQLEKYTRFMRIGIK